MATEKYRIIYDRKELGQFTDKADEINRLPGYSVQMMRDVVSIESNGNGSADVVQYLFCHLDRRPMRLPNDHGTS